MGAGGSHSLGELSSNKYLIRLSSSECLTANDPFWNQLLSFPYLVPQSSGDQSLLEESTVSICKNFLVNNYQTGNFGSLVRVFLIRSQELRASAQCQDDMFTWQTYNALFIIRNMTKFLIENLTEEVVLEQFEAKPSDGSAAAGNLDGELPLFDELLDSLMTILAEVPVVDVTYAVHLESINFVLTVLSIQLFQTQLSPNLKLCRRVITGKCSSRAVPVLNTLLNSYIQQLKCPAQLHADQKRHGMLYGLTSAVASGIWTVMTLGLANNKASKLLEDGLDVPLANQSLLLLLALVNHSSSDEMTAINLFREAFLSCVDVTSAVDSSLVTSPSRVKVNFSDLYGTLCHTLRDEQTTLLLYALLHRIEAVKAFVLSRTNIDQLIVPILKILYHASEGNSYHIYMALIVVLLLSEDNCFSKSVHEITLRNVVWFRERQISEISLGGLLILVLVRTIQYNMARLRDQYLHTNCLAALANMSSQFNNLHPYVAQRLVSLFASLQKKHTKIAEKLHAESHGMSNKTPCNGLDAKETPLNESFEETDQVQELAVVKEVMRMMLEIFNSCLVNSLHHNPNLVYTMLYQRALFTQLLAHSTFQDIVQNIDTVLNYFSSRLEQSSGSLSVGEVHAIIKHSSVLFKRDRLKKFAELKFRYVEEEKPEEFFVPYVWTLIYHSSNLYFNPSRVRLLSLPGANSP